MKNKLIKNIGTLNNKIFYLKKEIKEIDENNEKIKNKLEKIISSKYYLFWQKFNKLKKSITNKKY